MAAPAVDLAPVDSLLRTPLIPFRVSTKKPANAGFFLFGDMGGNGAALDRRPSESWGGGEG
jgi:hypothetical protein